VIAVVFSRLDPTLAARVLKRLPDPLQVDVVGRLENLDQISEEVAGQIEQNLQTWFADHRQRSQRRQVGQEVVKQIMRRAGHDTRRLITAGRKATAPPTDPAAAVAAGPAPTAPGSFAHVLQLDDRSLGRLLCAADPQDVVMALAGSPSDVIDRALRTMKPRAADRLREALGRLDTSQLPDVFRSQQKIADLAAELGRSSRRAKPAPAVAVSS
ncbi:MAG: hypothetical protein GTO03_00725, partial [Planctomycetales bacterium]|nr:hypothetical protein [Planctomycetales bacterium]